MKIKKFFLIVCTLCLSLLLSFGFVGCFGDGDDVDNTPVAVESVELSESSIELKVGESFTLVATILPANATDKSLNWSSSDRSVATVSGGKVTAVAAGTAKITVKSNGKKAECSVTVTDGDGTVTIPVESVTLNKTSLGLNVSETDTLIATVTPENASDKTLSWSSSDETVATVVNGTVTAVAVGKATITVTAGGKSATCTVTIETIGTVIPPIPAESVVLDKTSLELTVGETHTFTATVAPDNATDKTLTWSSDKTSVVTVTNGTVTAVAVGTAKITVTAGGKSATCTVTVKAKPVENVPVTEVTLDKTSIEMTAGDTQTLTATVAPANATDKTLTWSSDKTSVATVTNGTVTAVAVGTAKITVTAGGKSAECTVTVKAKVVPATGITLSAEDLELNGGETFTLTATVAPVNTTENDIIWTSSNEAVATVDNGVVTAVREGSAIITARAGSVTATCEIAVIKEEEPIPSDSIITYAHAGEESAAFEWKDTNASNAKVAYKLSSDASYTQFTDRLMLVRQISDTTARADILGLKGGVKYDFKITSSDGKISYARDVLISAQDRSGYAHHNYTSGVGAYNDDGTLKSDAVVFYVTEENKNNIDGNGNSIAEYLGNMKNVKTPVVIRIVGTVGSATWNEIKYDMGGAKKLSEDKVIGIDDSGKLPTDSKQLTQAALISGGYNTLNEYPAKYNGKKCVAIDGLNSKASYSGGEYDSCWNDCQVQYANNLTIEGVGEDAEIFQFGFTFKNCNSIEVRNLRFYDYTEDACSVEASSSTAHASDPDSFTYKHFWIHHNIFDIGKNYWDVCAEQDKGDGDGATDFKYISYVTVAYNRYNGTHKTGLVGGGDTVNTASLTFHHNYYNQCDQRMPLGRQANMHIYNNYFYKSGLYSISLRAGAYAFIENCVFTSKSTSTKPIELVKGDEKNGVPSAKVIDCEMEGTISNQITDVTNLYVGSDRTQVLEFENGNKYGLNFEQADGFYTVTNKLATNEVANKIPTLAGTMKRDSNIKIDGETEEEQPTTSGTVTMKVSDVVKAGTLEIKKGSDNKDVTQNFDNVKLADGMVLYSAGDKSKVTEHNNTVGDISFTHRIVLKGSGNYIKISVDKACTVKVYVANGSTTDTTGRYIGLYTDTAGTALVDGASATKLIGGEKQVVEYSVSAGTYYLESITNELSFYCIELIYS